MKSLMLLVFVCFFMLFFVGSLFQLDPDLGWHVFLGQKMTETGHLIQSAVGYNYFANLQLPDHEWLSDILLYRLSQIGSWAIPVFFVLISFVLAYLLYKIASRRVKTKSSVFTALLLVAISLSLSYGLRLQVFLFVAVALFIYINQAVSDTKRCYILYFIITAIGTNLHGGLLTILLVPILLEFPLLRLRDWKNTNYKKWIVLLLLLSTALLFNPYGGRFWQLASNYTTSRAYLSSISEWLPIYTMPIHLWNVIVPLSLVLFCFTINKYWQKMPSNWLILILVYGFLAIRFSRFFPIFMIVALPMVALAFEDIKTTVLVNKKTHWMPPVAIALFVSLFFMLNYQNQLSRINDPFSDISYPFGASTFLEKNQHNGGNLLNPYRWGGYLLWKNPAQTVFVDGRGPQLIAENNTSILEIYQKFDDKNQDTVKSQLKKYDISSVLLDTTRYQLDSFNTFLLKKSGAKTEDLFGTPNLQHYLENSPEWKKVYEDNISAVYFKKVTE